MSFDGPKNTVNAAPLELAFCLAHARRKFADVFKTTQSRVALEALARIAKVYEVENVTRERGRAPSSRLAQQRPSDTVPAASRARRTAASRPNPPGKSDEQTEVRTGQRATFSAPH